MRVDDLTVLEDDNFDCRVLGLVEKGNNCFVGEMEEHVVVEMVLNMQVVVCMIGKVLMEGVGIDLMEQKV